MADTPVLTLNRCVEFTAHKTTLGGLWENDELVCVTLERNWLNDKPFVSCLRCGVFNVVPHVSPKFGRCLSLLDEEIAPRSHVIFHSGNVSSDSEGCVIVGLGFGVLWGKPAVLSSVVANMKLLARYPDGFLLRIRAEGVVR